jgi:hypothetical protein
LISPASRSQPGVLERQPAGWLQSELSLTTSHGRLPSWVGIDSQRRGLGQALSDALNHSSRATLLIIRRSKHSRASFVKRSLASSLGCLHTIRQPEEARLLRVAH